ncbi:MAG: hypothetical protein D4R82_02645 [Dehalococcoidia bacterium]|nr:MAG: hypothetical protein D4R82_02645 [Dehalococcoidia bacterium]
MRNKIIIPLAIVLIAALWVVGCGPGVTPGEKAVEEQGPIKVGYIGALSSPWGLSEKTSLEISVEDMNAEGGILGRPVKLIIEDSKGEIPLVVASYKKLVMTNGCTLVVVQGTEPTFACMEVGAELYEEYPHLMFSIFVSHDGPTDMVCAEYDKYKFFFRPFEKGGGHWDSTVRIWEMFTDVIGTKKLAIMCEDMVFTEPMRYGIPGKYPSLAEAWGEQGLDVVYTGQNSIKEKMFLPILEEIAASGADTVYWITAYTDTATLAKQWAQSAAKDIDMVSMAGAPCLQLFWDMTGGAALGWCTHNAEVDIPYTEKSLPFLKELRARGVGMVSSTFYAYDSLWALKAAVEDVGNAEDVEALIKALETLEMQNIAFTWKFDKCHDLVAGYPPYMPHNYGQFQEDGKVVEIFPEGIRQVVNPDDHFVRVKELREIAGQ